MGGSRIKLNERLRRGFLLTTLGLTAFIASVTGFQIYSDAERLRLSYEHQAAEKAEEHVYRARIAAQSRCVPLAAKAEKECIREEAQAARQGQHDEYDLQAQLVTSAWTRAMGIAALIAMAVGIFGIGLVFITFREARRSADAARDAVAVAQDTAKRQLRAYLVAKTFRVVGMRPGGTPSISYEIKNVGQTPAYRVRATAKWFGVIAPDDPSYEKVYFGRLPERYSESIIGAGQHADHAIPVDEILDDGQYVGIRSGHMVIGLFGVVSYRDIFARRRLLTFKYYLSAACIEDDGSGKLFACKKGNAGN